MSMCVPPPAAVALATFDTRSASKLFSPEITCLTSPPCWRLVRYGGRARISYGKYSCHNGQLVVEQQNSHRSVQIYTQNEKVEFTWE